MSSPTQATAMANEADGLSNPAADGQEDQKSTTCANEAMLRGEGGDSKDATAG